MKTGIDHITEERARQITQEGWTASHDRSHQRGELIDAALSYIRAAINIGHPAMQRPPKEWPWDNAWWKPSDDPVRNLTKAGALIAAEIDRLQNQHLEQVAAELRRDSIPPGDDQGSVPGVPAAAERTESTNKPNPPLGTND